VKWNSNGNWLLTGGRDQLIKLFDVRMMRELATLKGQFKDVTSLAWNPVFETVFASGGNDGTLVYWDVGPLGFEAPQARIMYAHDSSIWDLAWHPSGHVLASASQDKHCKFWSRHKPGDPMGLSDFETSDLSLRGECDVENDSLQLGNHVGIVIGRKGSTIQALQRATKARMSVDQVKRQLDITGTKAQIDACKERVGMLLAKLNAQENNVLNDMSLNI